jgi:hypothetical protein
MKMKEIWFVEWDVEYSDRNAAFSTREKAIDYINAEAKRMELKDFGRVDENPAEHLSWGCYEFDGRDKGYPVMGVTFQCYPIDAE